MNKNLGIIGLGKLGLECAEVFAEHYTVLGYDIYPSKSDSVKVSTMQDTIENSDWIFIAVPTPHAEGYDGSVPSSHMEPRDFGHDAVKTVLTWINHIATTPKKVVLISTVLPGTTRRHFATLLDKKHQLLYNPYLIAMGSVKWDMVNPEMVIIGTESGDPSEMQELIDIYKPMMKNSPRYVTGTWDECESIKIFYNTFISAKVGLVNMVQDFALKIGNINVDVVTNALAASNMRIMGPKYMTAGMGDSGACTLPSFKININGNTTTIGELYDTFNTNDVFLVQSANYACTAKDEKKIAAVTKTKFSGDMLKFTTASGELVVTPNHLLPISRSGKRMLVRADEILDTDKLYKL